MNFLMARHLAIENNNKKDGPIFKVINITRTASTTQGETVSAPKVPGYSFVSWIGISCDDFVGSAYLEHFEQANNVGIFYGTKPSDSVSYHITVTALYVIRSKSNLVRVNSVEVSARTQSSYIEAPTIEGYSFLTWINVSSIGYVGGPYINSPITNPSEAWDRTTTAVNGTIRSGVALYLKANADELAVRLITKPVNKVQTVSIEADDIEGYSFLCWCLAASNSYVGRPNVRGRNSEECVVTDVYYTYQTASSSYLLNALYVKGESL